MLRESEGYSVSRQLRIVVLLGVLMALGLVHYQPPTAHATQILAADEPTFIDISDPVISSDTIPLKENTDVSFVWPWSLSGGQLDGQQFSIQFPKNFRIPTTLFNVLQDSAGRTVGECTSERHTNLIICTFDASLAHRTNATGTLTTDVKAISGYASMDIDFNINGVNRAITLPGDGPHGIRSSAAIPTTAVALTGQQISDTVMRWTVSAPGGLLTDKLGDQPLRIDTRLTGPRNAVGHVYVQSDAYDLIEYTQDQREDPFSVPGDQHYTTGIEQGIKDGGLAQSIVAQPPVGGWKTDRNYLLTFYSMTADTQPVAAPIQLTSYGSIHAIADNVMSEALFQPDVAVSEGDAPRLSTPAQSSASAAAAAPIASAVRPTRPVAVGNVAEEAGMKNTSASALVLVGLLSLGVVVCALIQVWSRDRR